METKKAIVLTDFYDKETRGLLLKEGESITREPARIDHLVKLGLVKAEGEEKGMVKVEEIDLSKTWQQIVADIKNCDNLENLKASLTEESGKEKPRPSVVKVLEERIAELEK